MKKIIFLLTLLFANMVAEAQIQRSFFGLELGVWSKQNNGSRYGGGRL